MDRHEAMALIDRVLGRAAEALGDITEPVIALFNARHPEAQALFRHHDAADPQHLEGSMIEQAIYCLMYWHESPGEIDVLLSSTMPHHIETLGVSEELFAALLKAVCDTVGKTIPPEEAQERAAWSDLETSLLAVIARGAGLARQDIARHFT